MRRREFMGILGGTAAVIVTGPHSLGAQSAVPPVVGFLSGASSSSYGHLVSKFHDGLGQVGFVEGKNVAVEYRWAEGQYARLPALAADLINRRVAVIATTGGNVAAVAAKRATTTIPIVFMSGSNPVAVGLVASLSRPDGNLTGVNLFTNETGAKRLELLHSLVPAAKAIGVLVHRTGSNAPVFIEDVLSAGRLLGLQIHFATVESEHQIDSAFTDMVQAGAGALLVQFTPLFTSRRAKLVSLAAQHAIPALYGGREYAEVGGLMSYGSSLAEAYRQVGVYAGRILKGEKPADLPVVQAAKFDLVINLKTAKSLGIAVPPTLLAIADEVIE